MLRIMLKEEMSKSDIKLYRECYLSVLRSSEFLSLLNHIGGSTITDNLDEVADGVAMRFVTRMRGIGKRNKEKLEE